jgi:taurine dioxygenase
MGTLVVEQLTASIGAEVTGLGLEDVLGDPAAQAEIRAALWQHQVLAFREQFLDDEAHVALAACFGEPFVHPIGLALGRTEPFEEIADDAAKLPDRDGWHTDAPFVDQPPSAAILRAVKVPPSGGDTLWANMYDAYDAISPAMQGMLGGVRVQYPPQEGLIEYVRRHAGDELADRVRELAGDGADHPLVRTHPETGRRALYFARGFAGSMVGLHDDEAAALWSFLEPLPANPNIQCRWHWHEGDVVIWDEAATQHFGAADHRGQERVMRRVLVTGGTPA